MKSSTNRTKRARKNASASNTATPVKAFVKSLKVYHDVPASKLEALWDDAQVKATKRDYRDMLQAFVDALCKHDKRPSITVFVSLRPKLHRFAKFVSAIHSANKQAHITLYPIRAQAYPINRIYVADFGLLQRELVECYEQYWKSIKVIK